VHAVSAVCQPVATPRTFHAAPAALDFPFIDTVYTVPLKFWGVRPRGWERLIVGLMANSSLMRAIRVEMPITEQMHAALNEGRAPREAIRELMERRLKQE
jgi:hypothetical protein